MRDVLIYLAAAVIVVPIFARLKLGSILGYIGAGVLIGPHALKFIGDVENVAHIAELGVVFLLFVIGLELKPARLWVLRHFVFGLGLTQVLLCGAALALLGVWLLGQPPKLAIIIGCALALSSTAFAIQLLTERRELTTRAGRKSFSILLFQDIAVVPLIALIPALAPTASAEALSFTKALSSLLLLALIVIAGRVLLQPALNLIAASRSREVFTAGALLLVLGMASAFAWLNLSLALGAFVAGVLLADSAHRHQLEADIEPFRGLLLGLFFMAVGMSLNLSVVAAMPVTVIGLTLALLAIKSALTALLARTIGGASWPVAWRTGLIIAPGGEFAFVVFTVAAHVQLMSGELKALLVAVVILSMLTAPALISLGSRLGEWFDEKPGVDPAPIETPPRALILGYGRVGKIVSKVLRSRDISYAVLEYNPAIVRSARLGGQRVYFGDCKRAEVLRAAGAEHVELIVVSFSEVEESVRAVRAIKHHFPTAKVLARAGHRAQSLDLMEAHVDFIVREAFEAALALSKAMLKQLNVDETDAQATVEHFRDRDHDEFMAALRLRQLDSELDVRG